MGKTNQLGVLADVFTSDASNNVGIGGSPSGSYKLEVTGTSRVSGAALFSSSVTIPSSSGIILGTTGSTDGIISSVSGTVGLRLRINTTDALVIASSGAATFSSSVDGTIFNSTSNAFRFSGSNALSLVTLNSQNVVKVNAAGYWGVQLVGANDQGIVINNTGLVGIGTTAPLKILHIAKGGNDNGILFTDDAAGNYRNEINNTYSGSAAGSNLMTFKVSNGTTTGQTNVMNLNGSGFVSIGQVPLPGNVQFKIRTSNQSSSNYALGIDNSVTDLFYVRNDGYLLSPTTYNNTTASGANMSISASGFFERSTSSIRFKTEVEDLTIDTSSILSKMRPIWYRSLGENDKKEWSWYGFIAEELAEIEPRLVQWGYDKTSYENIEIEDKEGNITQENKLKKDAVLIPDGVQYERITVLLVAEIQKMNQTIQNLQEQNQDLKSRLDKAGL